MSNNLQLGTEDGSLYMITKTVNYKLYVDAQLLRVEIFWMKADELIVEGANLLGERRERTTWKKTWSFFRQGIAQFWIYTPINCWDMYDNVTPWSSDVFRIS